MIKSQVPLLFIISIFTYAHGINKLPSCGMQMWQYSYKYISNGKVNDNLNIIREKKFKFEDFNLYQ
jgi:hypothetical protein